MSTADDGVPDRAFVTWLSRWVPDDEYDALLPWWRRRLVEQALDVPDAGSFQRIADDLAAIRRFLFGVQVEVSSKGELIDGRTKRPAGPPAGAAASSAAAKRSRR